MLTMIHRSMRFSRLLKKHGLEPDAVKANGGGSTTPSGKSAPKDSGTPSKKRKVKTDSVEPAAEDEEFL